MLRARDGPPENATLSAKVGDLHLSSQTYFPPSINKFGTQNANLGHDIIASSS